MGRGFKSFCPCQNNERVVAQAMALLLFCAWVGGLEGEAVVNDSPVDCQSRGRPSAQFARESNPIISTIEWFEATQLNGLIAQLVRAPA